MFTVDGISSISAMFYAAYVNVKTAGTIKTHLSDEAIQESLTQSMSMGMPF
jgi:hypothetical protein